LATLSLPPTASKPAELKLSKIAAFLGMRVLAWHNDLLYASRGYELLRAKIVPKQNAIHWEHVATAEPAWWRKLSCFSRLTARLFRDGFHALAVLQSGGLVAAIPNAIVTLLPGEPEFSTTHRVLRGTRPLHLAVTPNNNVFWGEYFDNPLRDEVHVYASTDDGRHWDVAYSFPRNSIRHVHNIVYDQWENCLWILTGDSGRECRIIRASCDFRDVQVLLSGSQQTRSAALVPAPDGLYFSSDTPLEQNHIYHLDRRGNLTRLSALISSSICACCVGEDLFFSTMVEPSPANPHREVGIYGRAGTASFGALLSWQKDAWPMRLFQYGNAVFPDGDNSSGVLALTTIAVKHSDCETSLWRISH